MAQRAFIATGAVAVVLMAAFGAASGAGAAPKTPGRAQIVERLSACRQIQDATERLTCYDAAAAALDQAEKSGEVVVADRAQIHEVKRQAFGLNFSQALTVFDRGDKPDQIEEVTLTVAKVGTDENNRWVLTMDDGQVWRQTDDAPLAKDPKKGSQALITRGSLGSFFVKVDGQPSFRAHRDQ
jgi:hypothetical protein